MAHNHKDRSVPSQIARLPSFPIKYGELQRGT